MKEEMTVTTKEWKETESMDWWRGNDGRTFSCSVLKLNQLEHVTWRKENLHQDLTSSGEYGGGFTGRHCEQSQTMTRNWHVRVSPSLQHVHAHAESL